MPFTNEEVEQFKAYQGPDRARILALLARLAAAERTCAELPNIMDMHPTYEDVRVERPIHRIAKNYWAWRKAAGK